VLSAYGLDNGRKYFIEWKVSGGLKKKDKKGETKRKLVVQKTVEWEEDFSFTSSLNSKTSKGTNKPTYDEKNLHFSLKEDDGKKGNSFGTLEVDLAEFVDSPGVSKVLSIKPKKAVKDAAAPTLEFKLSSILERVDGKKLVKADKAVAGEKSSAEKIQMNGEEFYLKTADDDLSQSDVAGSKSADVDLVSRRYIFFRASNGSSW